MIRNLFDHAIPGTFSSMMTEACLYRSRQNPVSRGMLAIAAWISAKLSAYPSFEPSAQAL
jgi:hypothetical protein